MIERVQRKFTRKLAGLHSIPLLTGAVLAPPVWGEEWGWSLEKFCRSYVQICNF